MAVDRLTYRFPLVAALLTMLAANIFAQTRQFETSDTTRLEFHSNTSNLKEIKAIMPDSLTLDSTYREMTAEMATTLPDSARLIKNGKRRGNGRLQFRKPDPVTATWLALVIPGGGQIYNRKFWKLPIVYGGFVGCLYAYNWNGQMYKDYKQAYLDIMDSDPNTNSYKDFFRPGYDYEANKEYLSGVFKKRKDRYRRWRDLSIFSFIGVYALSVIDAYVDAQLSSFDISEDINLSIEPQIIDSRQLYGKDYYGFNCNIRF